MDMWQQLALGFGVAFTPMNLLYVLAGCLLERPAYRQAQNGGHAITETRFAGLRAQADALIQSLIDKATE